MHFIRPRLLAPALMALSMCLAAACRPLPPAQQVSVQDAGKAAQAWLALVDAADYTGSWTAASGFFRAVVTQEQWLQSMQAFRTPLGPVQHRANRAQKYATALPGAPDGAYVILEFDTSFARKQEGVETVTMMLDTDQVWRVSGFFIR